MRPRVLELAGFTAFREPVTVDFRGAELFALTGPTGSGKSSLIDAIVFALYGSVPRVDKHLVAPVVSLGKLETRVRFEFVLDGENYTVVRVVRRTKAGATTAEARLERSGEVLAGNADEVTAAVQGLLGLGFDHFTKSVVLPQGQFQRFLHDQPAERQRLLRQLLDLGVYERMRDLARQRRAAAEGEIAVLSAQLEELASATPEAEQEAKDRLQRLERLQVELDEAEPELASRRRETEQLTGSAERARASIGLLEHIRIPEAVAPLSGRLAGAREAGLAAAQRLEAANQELGAAQGARAELPAPGELERIAELHRTLDEERNALVGLEGGLTEAADAVASAEAAEQQAGRAAGAARRQLEEARRLHAAHAVAATLVAGEPCPVCGRPVEELPSLRPPGALTDAEAALEEAGAEEERARATTAAARQDLATRQARREDLAARVADLEKQLQTAPDRPATEEALGRVAAAEASLVAARQSASEAAEAEKAARRAVEDLDREASTLRRDFDRTRDRVAALEPPVPSRNDLAADWEQLSSWARQAIGRLSEEVAQADRRVEEIHREIAQRQATLSARLEKEGLQVDSRPLRDVAVAAVTAAHHELGRLRESAERAEAVRASIKEGTEVAEVARVLGQHLSAAGFEGWLMEEALATLVEGANSLLADLAGGAYSLEAVKRDFRIIDHRNADEPRPVKTLSGGETFLVSLSLALSLAGQLASMSVHGGGRLESIFLDEGFGTLDAETLDTVAHVIQELGARGRTVGIVTHVRELAEQVPVRFEVRRGPGTATVERVDL